MSRTAAVLVGGGIVAVGAIVLVGRDANAQEGRGDGPEPPDVSPFLFEEGPDGTVAFKPSVSAALLNTMLAARAFRFPNQGGDPNVIELLGALQPGQASARDWAIEENKDHTILAVRHLSVPTAPPPNGPMVLMMAIQPGTERFHTEGDSLWAVFAMVGSLQNGIFPSDPRLPTFPSGPVPSIPADPRAPFPGGPPPHGPPIPPPGVLDDVLPPAVPPFIPPTAPPGALPPLLQAEVDRVMTDPNVTPEQLLAVAAILRAAGFPNEAAALEAQAAILKAKAGILDATALRQIQIKANGTPFPAAVALHYTGDPNRWKEIPLFNPGMEEVHNQGPQKASGIIPWASQIVNIPPTWPAKPTPPAGAIAL